MTRICAWCKTNLGERCPRCSSLKVTVEAALIDDEPARAICGACGNHFRRGDGGETHGCCEGCRAKAMSTKLAASPGKLELAWSTELSAAMRFITLRHKCNRAAAWAALVSVMQSPDTQKRIGSDEL